MKRTKRTETSVLMRNNRGKRRRKKGKTSQRRAKELSSTGEDEINLKGNKEGNAEPVRLKLICADPYSLYERTSLRQGARKEHDGSETALEKCEEDRKHVSKGQHKLSLPPLRERRLDRKQLTFEDGGRVIKHSILDTKTNNKIQTDNIAVTSEGRNKLALSLSFAGIYDLDEMNLESITTNTKRNNKLDGILKSSSDKTETKDTLGKTEGFSDGVTKSEDPEKNNNERTKCYVIKTLTLEDESPSSQRTLFQDKLVLPGIKKSSVPTHSTKGFGGECKVVAKARGENRLPRIVESENRTSTFADSCSKRTNIIAHRRKERVHDNSFEQVYLGRNMPWLPVLINGRTTMS